MSLSIARFGARLGARFGGSVIAFSFCLWGVEPSQATAVPIPTFRSYRVRKRRLIDADGRRNVLRSDRRRRLFV